MMECLSCSQSVSHWDTAPTSPCQAISNSQNCGDSRLLRGREEHAGVERSQMDFIGTFPYAVNVQNIPAGSRAHRWIAKVSDQFGMNFSVLCPLHVISLSREISKRNMLLCRTFEHCQVGDTAGKLFANALMWMRKCSIVRLA